MMHTVILTEYCEYEVVKNNPVLAAFTKTFLLKTSQRYKRQKNTFFELGLAVSVVSFVPFGSTTLRKKPALAPLTARG